MEEIGAVAGVQLKGLAELLSEAAKAFDVLVAVGDIVGRLGFGVKLKLDFVGGVRAEELADDDGIKGFCKLSGQRRKFDRISQTAHRRRRLVRCTNCGWIIKCESREGRLARDGL